MLSAQPHIVARARPLLLRSPQDCFFSIVGSEPSWVSNVGLSFEPFAASDRHACSISRGYFSRGGHASNAIEFAFRITRPAFCRLLTTYVAHGIALHWWSMSSQWYRIHIVCVCVSNGIQCAVYTHANGATHKIYIWLAQPGRYRLQKNVHHKCISISLL